MGAAISIPLAIPSMIASSLSSCFGAAMCSACLSSTNPLSKTFKSSIATRITYAIIFLINSVLSWVSLSNIISKKLEKLTWGLFKFGRSFCDDDNNCTGFTNVHRLNLSLGFLHIIIGLLLIGVRSTSNPRAVIQNGFWKTKIFIWLTFITLSFMIPDKFFVVWGNYFSIIFSTLFIGIETCLEKIEEGEIYLGDGEDGVLQNGNFWKTVLVGGTISMYLGCIIMSILMYIYFSHSGCNLNTTAITLNLVFTIVITTLSITPIVQEYNSNAGLAQASMCCIYCTYLIFSACLSEPDDKLCNPLIRSKGTRTISIVMGAFFTFVAVAYTTTRAAGNSAFSHSSSNAAYTDSQYDSVADIITSQPSLRNEMRLEAIRQAVNEGSLPESALNNPGYLYDDDDEDESGVGEEVAYTKYNYFLFHIIFFLATQYIAALLTINVGADENGDGEGSDFRPVGRTYFNTWVKIVSSWVCYALYTWSLIAPVLFPDRFGS
ncbi:hypothetical protein PACTADRAFT_51164 [Pachysolen tannophilus NRRL Y-2460]|uniref:Membrane protein TMS1 n=1 Tax=Pachysolen tannophilus NRRL Y-2460 TaxID=669874 RepID=A0A1E4TRD7_PACTA|nr:hypothetical protein PACTADRAFT_51164 [Pachysolen tannophilus NRRL Y-2460]